MPTFANELQSANIQDEVDVSNVQDDKNKTEENFTPVKIMKTAHVYPKKEHKKLMYKTLKSLEKDKEKFQKTKENELKLLNIEYNILKFNP